MLSIEQIKDLTEGEICTIVSRVVSSADKLFDLSNVDSTHGIEHALSVLAHVNNAIDCSREKFSNYQKLCMRIGAILHDADDKKFFKTHNYSNARNIISVVCVDLDSDFAMELENDSIEIISLVSFRENKNKAVAEEWKLYVRWCDRLEAIGYYGIYRVYEYGIHTKRDMYTSSTPRAKNVIDINIMSAMYDAESPISLPAEPTMIGHFYEKVLHLIRMTFYCTNNYINVEAIKRHQVCVDFVLKFGLTGHVDEHEVINMRYND
jgi:uncharacterized protein